MDLTGGMHPACEYVLPKPPEDPLFSEGDSIWVVDDEGRFVLPRLGVEALAGDWERRGIHGCVAFADGRVLAGAGPGPAHPWQGPDGRPRVFGAGPCRLIMVDPFERWLVQWYGPMRDNVAGRNGSDARDDSIIDIELDVFASMALPPWGQGQHDPEAAAMLQSSAEALLIGGARYEQLFRCAGKLKLGDDEPIEFNGTGLRVHRMGVQDLSASWGHNWQSALFPSGRGFGFISYPPRPDGSPSYSEGYLFDSGVLHPARVVSVERLASVADAGADVSVVLATDTHGSVHIEGRTFGSTFSPAGAERTPGWPVEAPAVNAVTYEQGAAVYTWDGERANGMVERSMPAAAMAG